MLYNENKNKWYSVFVVTHLDYFTIVRSVSVTISQKIGYGPCYIL